jgi:hypothetical protein
MGKFAADEIFFTAISEFYVAHQEPIADPIVAEIKQTV